jgi:hypothetical protein
MPDPQGKNFFETIFGPPGAGEHLGFFEVCLRLIFAGVLGCAVAASWWFSTRGRPRTIGLPSTLVLLSILIALVTLAIGDNAAKAFTLVGTLAIVRFRTAVRDIRDTAFVIFAVAVGIAVGAFNPFNALAGTVVVGTAASLVNWRSGAADRESILAGCAGRLLVRFDPASPNLTELEPVISAHTRFHQLIMSRDGRDGALRLLYAVDIDRGRGIDLVTSLRDIEGVRRVTLTFGEIEDED